MQQTSGGTHDERHDVWHDKIAEASLPDEAASERKSELAPLTDKYGPEGCDYGVGILFTRSRKGKAAIEAAMQAKELGVEKAKKVDEHAHVIRGSTSAVRR
jgi:hypothetical protein